MSCIQWSLPLAISIPRVTRYPERVVAIRLWHAVILSKNRRANASVSKMQAFGHRRMPSKIPGMETFARLTTKIAEDFALDKPEWTRSYRHPLGTTRYPPVRADGCDENARCFAFCAGPSEAVLPVGRLAGHPWPRLGIGSFG